MPRLFVAIPVPRLPEIGALCDTLGSLRGVKSARPRNLHVTLRFLGDVDAALVEPLSHAMERAAEARVAFDLELGAIGVFPNRAEVRVVWVGFKQTTALTGLAEAIDAAIAGEASLAALPPRDWPLKPHVTVARVARERAGAAELDSLLDSPPPCDGARFRVDAFHLMASDLRPTGPVYTRAATFDLTA